MSSTHINNLALVALAIALVSLGACAKRPLESNTVANVQAEQTPPGLDPTTPAGVVALPAELMAHPRSVYSAGTGKYSYYIGGLSLATYDSDSRVLVITGADQAEGTTCKYAPDGALYIDPQSPTGQANGVTQCNALITELYQHMRR